MVDLAEESRMRYASTHRGGALIWDWPGFSYVHQLEDVVCAMCNKLRGARTEASAPPVQLSPLASGIFLIDLLATWSNGIAV